MKNILLLCVAFSLFWGCASSDDDVQQQPFVTQIVMPSASEPFAPGDAVTVSAVGFEADDDIMLRITWPLTGTAVQEGYADGVWGIVTARTGSSITFLAPGHYPAGTVEVKLFRRGKVMPMGTISVADGQAPEEFLLYGITNGGEAGAVIDRIDTTTGEVMQAAVLGAGQDLACAVNVPGSNSVYGVSPQGGNGAAVSYDLTMHYYRDSGSNDMVLAGVVGNYSTAAFLRHEADRLVINSLSILPVRSIASKPASWMLPEGMEPAALGRYPFVTSASGFLLAADKGDGSFSAVLLEAGTGNETMIVGEPVQADEMVPFQLMLPAEEGNSVPVLACGYAVASAGKTELRLFDPSEMVFTETLGEIEGAVRSVARRITGEGVQELYLLCDTGTNERQIRVYDLTSKSVRTLPGKFGCSEIVMVR